MANLGYTPASEIPGIRDDLHATFRSGKTKPTAWRRHQLLQLARYAQDNAEGLAASIHLDLGRPTQEAIMAEVGPTVQRCLTSAEKLEEWTSPEELTVADWQQGWKPRVEKHPKGVVLIIAPWNYPLILSLAPLAGAIAAGCCAVIKPSEISPRFSSYLARTLTDYLDPSAYRVVLGAIPETTRLLELKWDHIFYTGNGRVGRIVAAAAAKHLTPLTLELGGKSPVIVDSTADISLSAKRILWGKINNSGQICVAPDFVLAEESIVPDLVKAFKEHYKAFYPKGPLGSDYGKIVSDVHFARLKGLLGRSKGKVEFGGKWTDAEMKFEPTVVVDVKNDDALLEEEIFGPILPIIAVKNLDEAIEFINNREHPLVLYAFTTSEDHKKKIVQSTASGGVTFNDTFQQLSVSELPFGGVGESGYGRQGLKHTFNNFVYDRSIVDIPFDAESFLGVRYPPYTKESLEIMSAALKLRIPDSTPPA